MDLGKDSQQLFLALQVLEEVTAERHIDSAFCQRRKV